MKIQYEEDSSTTIEINNPMNYELELGIALSESLHRNAILAPEVVQVKVAERLEKFLREN
ncbi:hypothetical protein THOM_1384 [Trachipleistophora hominis]|uniref:Uncharacterized protein n=1 Tax=Trachipleistophora hominis TaxID=72359 RepID=L7JYB1_TRAHO|nr:hypothetical protein THOM_1384 [Trachipleistophora hominis]